MTAESFDLINTLINNIYMGIKNTQNLEKFLTTGQIAEKCGVNFRTVIRWIQKGYLRAYRLPGSRADHRIPASEFEKFLETYQLNMIKSESLVPEAPLILIVEDDVSMARSLERILRRKGFETLVANDGFLAGMMLRERSPQLVTLDLKMKGMDGFAVMKNIRKSKEFNDIKILVISGDTQSRLDEALRQGASAVLSKPFTSNDLIACVQKLISTSLINKEAS